MKLISQNGERKKNIRTDPDRIQLILYFFNSFSTSSTHSLLLQLILYFFKLILYFFNSFSTSSAHSLLLQLILYFFSSFSTSSSSFSTSSTHSLLLLWRREEVGLRMLRLSSRYVNNTSSADSVTWPFLVCSIVSSPTNPEKGCYEYQSIMINKFTSLLNVKKYVSKQIPISW